MNKPPFKPSKKYPHMWCEHTHFGLNILNIAIILLMFVKLPEMIIVMVATLGVLTPIGLLAVKKGWMDKIRLPKWLEKFLLEQSTPATPGHSMRVPIDVHPGWVTLAVGLDILGVFYFATRISYWISMPFMKPFADHKEDYALANQGWFESDIIGYAYLVGVALWAIAHHKATKPGGPGKLFQKMFGSLDHKPAPENA